jgi:signal transduction histidine kinase
MEVAHQGPDGTIEEARERGRLADLIDEYRDEVIARWMARVEAELKPSVGGVQLRNAMPDYLARLAAALRAGDPLRAGGTSAWEDIAREHAIARVRLGFNVDQLVREFVVLRQVLSEIGRERGARVEIAQVRHIADLIDAAISSAVGSYVDARDYAARQKEAEHISFIIHELRNPLSAAKLAATRLRQLMPDGNPGLFDVLDRNINRLEGLVSGVLDMERLQAGKVQPHLSTVELGELLDAPIVTARMAAEAKGLTLRATYDPHVLLQVDRDLSRSAISNVIDNAVKYTDSGEVLVVAESGVDHTAIHVRDNCPGLSKEELHIIFEPFERGHSRKPGSGLGLAIARRALEAEGGSIGAESPGERGCHFWLTLPRAAH